MLAYTYYEFDNRVMRYAETLVKQGHHVDVIALRGNSQSQHESIKGVNIYRIQKRVVNEKKELSYLFKIMRFFIYSMIFLNKKHFCNRYNAIHVHNVPDFLVFAAALPKLCGTKIILDIHDIVPEFYASKFNKGNGSIIFKALVFLEKLSMAFADHVIISNHIWQQTLVGRSIAKEKSMVILNYPDPDIFYRRARTRPDNKFIMIYPGSLNWHQGLDVAIKAFAKIKNQVPEAEFHIYGDGTEKSSLEQLIYEGDLEKRILLKGMMPIYEMATVMASADLAIVPKRANGFGNEAFSTKILEFMMLGVPLIISETKVDRYYFNDSIVQFFKAEDENDLARCMLLLIGDKEERERLVANASKFIENYTWDKKKDDYLNLVDRLTNSVNGE
jgi:glycosyltransferase involved in cell wall biosynthesis